MTRVINVIFENEVLKPLQKADIKEHEKVAIEVLDFDERQRRFNQILEKIHKKATQYPPEEIEADISRAMKEVREGERER